MLDRRQLPAARALVLALVLALVAGAAARPDKRSLDTRSPAKGGAAPITGNSVQLLPEPVAHPVTPLSDAQPKADQQPSTTKNTENSIPVASPSDAKTALVVSTEQEVVPQRFRDNLTPVNKRYPHAVLFGGTCGGTIIDKKWVLSAGHCTLFTGGRYVLAGTNNSDDGSGVTRKVKKLHIHPLFSVGPYWLNAEKFGIKQVAARWDFLLAELDEPLELDGVNIAAAPLDEGGPLPPYTYVGYAGYGTDRHGGYMRSEMHAMHLKVQTDTECSVLEQYRNKDMLCAKGYAPNFDSACNGDSGSGLVSGDGKLVGIASWVQNDSIECVKGNLVVFSRVASARDWIRKISGV